MNHRSHQKATPRIPKHIESLTILSSYAQSSVYNWAEKHPYTPLEDDLKYFCSTEKFQIVNRWSFFVLLLLLFPANKSSEYKYWIPR